MTFLLPAYAETKGRIEVANVECKSGEYVDVTITITQNPGIVAMRLFLEYDSNSLELIEVEDKGLLGSNVSLFGNDKRAIPYTMLWENSISPKNFSDTGTLALLKFKVLENAKSGKYAITVKCDEASTFNTALNDVGFEVSSGSVTVLSSGNENHTAQSGTEKEITTTSTTIANVSTVADPESKGKIEVDYVESQDGEYIDVQIKITQNPGIVALSLLLDYNTELLELINADDKGLLASSLFGNDKKAIPYALQWENGSISNNTDTGLLAVVRFKIRENVQDGNYSVTVKHDRGSTFNSNLEDIDFDIHNKNEDEKTKSTEDNSRNESASRNGNSNGMRNAIIVGLSIILFGTVIFAVLYYRKKRSA